MKPIRSAVRGRSVFRSVRCELSLGGSVCAIVPAIGTASHRTQVLWGRLPASRRRSRHPRRRRPPPCRRATSRSRRSTCRRQSGRPRNPDRARQGRQTACYRSAGDSGRSTARPRSWHRQQRRSTVPPPQQTPSLGKTERSWKICPQAFRSSIAMS
jgi:hypothetical protein